MPGSQDEALDGHGNAASFCVEMVRTKPLLVRTDKVAVKGRQPTLCGFSQDHAVKNMRDLDLSNLAVASVQHHHRPFPNSATFSRKLVLTDIDCAPTGIKRSNK